MTTELPKNAAPAVHMFRNVTAVLTLKTAGFQVPARHAQRARKAGLVLELNLKASQNDTSAMHNSCVACSGFPVLSPSWLHEHKANNAHLIKGKLALKVDKEPAVAEKVIEAGLGFHESMHGRIQQLD